MTGAGTGELLIGRETSFGGSVVDSNANNSPDIYAPGRNETIEELDLDRQLARMRESTAAEPVESIAQNIEGAVAISAVPSSDTQQVIKDIVFNSGPGNGFTSGQANSAKIFTEVDYLSGTATRQLDGCIPLEFSITYTQGELVRYTLRMGYQDEQKDVSIDTTDAVRVSDGTSAPHHGFDLSIDATSISKLQSCTLTISDIARYHFGTSNTAVDATIAGPDPTFEAEAIFNTEDQFELAYGTNGATSPNATMDSVAATITIDTGGGTNISTYEFSSVKPRNYSWNEVVSTDDTTDSYTFDINDGVAVS